MEITWNNIVIFLQSFFLFVRIYILFHEIEI